MQDESVFIEQLLASERVADWLHAISAGNAVTRDVALVQLAQAVQDSQTYATEVSL